MVDTIFQDDELITKRFSCDCLFSGHILDVSVELIDGGKRGVGCVLNLYMGGKAPFKYRLKQIWNLLRGEEGQLADFYLREKDIPELAELLGRAIVSPHTSGT